MRLSKIAKELNISISRLAEFLDSKGHAIDVRPTTKISQEQYDILLQEFNKDFYEKRQSSEAIELKKQEKETQIERKIDVVESNLETEKEEKPITNIKEAKEIVKDNNKEDVDQPVVEKEEKAER